MGDGSGWLPTGISTIQHTYYDAGNYSVFLTLEDVNFCSGTYLQDSFNLTVTPHPELEITSSNPPICDPNTGFITVNTTLTANLNNAALFATIAYSWSTGATTASISVTNVGTYTCWVTATTPNGASAWTNIASLPANTATYTDNNVSPSTIYYYKVAAFNNIGEEFSNTDSAKTLATAIPPPFKGSISLFPNPNKGSFRLNIETEIAQSATFTVYDMLGKIVYTQPLNLSSGTQSISMVLFQQIASGIYLAELSTSKGKWTEKMVVE
jgi:uncharacterized membrane protein